MNTQNLRANENYLTSNLPYCIEHPQQQLTNLCKQCNYPLCPVCIKVHYAQHKGGNCEIESAEISRQECFNDIDDVHEVLKSQKNKLDHITHYQNNEMKRTLIEDIRAAYEAFIAPVKEYFKSLEEETIRFVDTFHVSDPEKVEHVSKVLSQDIEKITNIKKKLNTTAYLKQVIKVCIEYK